MTQLLLPPCIVCGAQMRPVDEHAPGQPDFGLIFTAKGQFGSRVFDDIPARYRLKVIICDPCLLAKADHIRQMEIQRTVEIQTTPWQPHEDTTDEGLQPQ